MTSRDRAEQISNHIYQPLLAILARWKNLEIPSQMPEYKKQWEQSRSEIVAAIEQFLIEERKAAIEEEREACADIARQIKQKELRRLDLETCCSNTAAEIEECIRARSS